ncbi:MAG: hypothetical protein HZLCBSQH_000522 [Candidatus Fervidibacterota bacterium]
MKGAALWRFAGPCLFVALSVGFATLVFFSGCSNKVVTPVYTPQQIARGEYLANFVSACVDCHTPLNPDGSLDTSRLFAGGREFIPGKERSANITPDPNTGIGRWTDDQIVLAIKRGLGHFEMNPNGQPLVPIMPYYVYANMTDDDARAIVAYLRTKVRPVRNQVLMPDPSVVPPQPAPPLNYHTLPGNDNDPGKYLTSAAGVCIECHTPRRSQNPADLDPTKFFAGGEPFPIPNIGTVYSANITPDAKTGIGNWTVDQIVVALTQGKDAMGHDLCPPMGPLAKGLFSHMSPSDLNNIANFLKTVPPVNNPVPECPLHMSASPRSPESRFALLVLAR